MKTIGAAYSQIAIHFRISETGTITTWNVMLLKEDIEALFRAKGRPQQAMTKLKSCKPTKTLTCE